MGQKKMEARIKADKIRADAEKKIAAEREAHEKSLWDAGRKLRDVRRPISYRNTYNL